MPISVRSCSKAPTAAAERLRCAVITPVGPGHQLLAEDGADSVAAAFERNAGPFTDVDIIQVDDTQGLLGRSEARNRGVREAQRRNAQWIFFLDADDLMHPDAFGAMEARHRESDAVWGLICELTPDEEGHVERAGQVREFDRMETILVNDPTLTLQMGHFVRTAAAAANPFNSALDCGEDFDYYLRVWQEFRCRKIAAPLFLNRRGMHSEGARSATGRQWRESVERVIAAKCASVGLSCEFVHEGERFRFRVSNPFDPIQSHHLRGTFFQLEELRFLRERVAHGATIVEVEANTGNHAVYFSRFLRPRRLIVFEADPRLLPELRANLETNNVVEAETGFLGLALGANGRPLAPRLDDASSPERRRRSVGPAGEARSVPLDAVIPDRVDLIRIGVSCAWLDVLAGAQALIGRFRPRIFSAVLNAGHTDIERWSRQHRYRIGRRFEYADSANVFLDPA